MTAALWRHPELSPKGRSIKPDRQILMPCLKVAVPNMLQRFCTSLGYVVFASMINSLGQLSTAAHTIANTVESAFYIPGYGMMTAAATLTGNAVGAKDSKRMNEMATVIIVLEVSMMVVSGTLLFLFAPAMAGLFSKDEGVIRLAGTVLRMVALSEPFYGISIVTEGMLQGAGQTKMPFVFNVLCMWGIRIAGTYLCIRLLGLGLISAWGCMIGNNMLLLVMFRLYFRFGKWRKELETAV
jgi:putative MATE family efflux protein